MKIAEKTSDPVINLALDTVEMKKQALVFVNAKRSAEKVAEDICKKSSLKNSELDKLSESVLKVLSRPTKQCERLALCVKRGIAFHHSGLHHKQKELVEDAFRAGVVKIICCTPTLAAGVDLPAFRTIIRDVRRFTAHGMTHIPVLEFLQMAGRAGRPKFDSYGESIVICQTETDKEYIVEHYLKGVPEDIYSKLAVEPVLRMYLLSLITTRIISSEESILDFFSRTFWAHQYKDLNRMARIINKTLSLLVDWGFLQDVQEGYRATALGRRVAELYVDPLTAFNLLNRLEKATHIKLKSVSFLHAVSSTLEMRPLLRVKQKEQEEVEQKYALLESYLLEHEPSMFEPEYEDWLDGLKTALMLEDWIDEKDEEWIMEHYDCRPGETRVKIDNADWLLYACHELARLMQYQDLLKEIMKVRLRLKYGVKEELLPLIRLENIGRVRARKLFRAGIKDLGDIRKAPIEKLTDILGVAVAKSVKAQVGEKEFPAGVE
ncbi:MAG: helicase-related protein [Candidatus Woesearchaeota archaeon]|nr:helicase-related protein [Candidatus Woesearchaeota archaeon]